MKSYKIKVGGWGGKFADYTIEIPEGVHFFFEKGYLGTFAIKGSEHYTTIIVKDEYPEWVEYLHKNPFGGRLDEIDKYLVVTLNVIKDGNKLPVKPREEVFKDQHITFDNMVFLTHDENCRIINANRIIDFRHINDIDFICATRRDFFSQGEYFSLAKHTGRELGCIVHHKFDSHNTTETLYDAEAEEKWNTMVKIVMENMMYTPSKAMPCDPFDDKYKSIKEKLEQLKACVGDETSYLSYC